jgi:hypothetical protein
MNVFSPRFLCVLCVLCVSAVNFPAALHAQPIHITHEFANRNARSLIGLPSGSRKTLVETDGGLRWSQWSLKRKPLDSPFGFSGQMDGAVAIQTFRLNGSAETPLRAGRQSLYQGRYPFVVTSFDSDGLQLEELAFPAEAGSHGLDVVRLRCANRSAAPLALETRLSGKQRNLPGHAQQDALVTRDGYEIVLAQGAGAQCGSQANGLTLACRWSVPANSEATLWLKAPHDMAASAGQPVSGASGDSLLQQAQDSWKAIWAKGPRVHLPNQELEDFFYSSAAYVLILTEYDASGDLWILDGPTGYRQFWGRGEYFQARALNLLGLTDLARKSVEHAFHIQTDDGEWDGPPISGWPSWDNTGGNAAGAWDSFLFTHDRAWLAQAYPHLLAAGRWIHYHREESDLEAGDVPAGSKPIKRQIPWSCRDETSPPLDPGEKPYWSGLLPWSYGDSGLPEGHAFAHNYFALYSVEVARKAALELGRQEDAAWLSEEYESYRSAIFASIQRALQLEKEGPPYLPAMPTYPEAALSQSFLAVYPTGLYAAHDPLIDGLLARMERSEIHGLPTNMAWLGAGGVWPGESMNVAEIYLRRGEISKLVNMLAAALNHSYTTNVWREEIRADKTLPRACPNSTSNRNLDNGQGTGDMPEAWGNANLVNLVRDMLVLEDGGALRVLSGIPADWIRPGEEISVSHAPTILGGPVSLRLTWPAAGRMVLELETPPEPTDVIVRFPLADGRSVTAVRVDGQSRRAEGATVTLPKFHGRARVEVEFQ